MDEDQEAALIIELRRMNDTLERIELELEQRPSRVEFMLEEQKRALESIRVKGRSPLQSLLELEGPGGFRAKLLGFGGLTLVAAVLTGVVGVVAWLLLK